MSAESFGQRLKTMAENVLTLEVNTIVCQHVEAEKMPPPEHALIDVANAYRDWMKDHHGRADMWQGDEPSQASREVFLRIRQAAGALLEARRADGEKDLLERIRGNSDQMVGMFARLDAAAGHALALVRTATRRPPEIELLPEEVLVLRKAWELMLDEVLMQTTIQLDGDVVTRIRRRLADDPDGPTVMKLHEKAVATSTSFWEKLVQIMGGALRSLVELVGR